MQRPRLLPLLVTLVSLSTFGCASRADQPAVPKVTVRQTPPAILIKVDDLKDLRGKVNPRWQKVVDYLHGRQIHFGIGIICDSLEGDKPIYFNWIKALHDCGEVEFWNHGYDHKEWEENGAKLQEFKGPSQEQQQDHLARSQQLAKEKLGFTLPAFGSPFNATDANTLLALEKDTETKIWLYGNPATPAGKLVLDRVYRVNIENPTFLPDVEKFKDGYARYPQRPYFVIQGHPGHWDDARFEQFTKIIDFLVEQKAVFMTPSEYATTLTKQ